MTLFKIPFNSKFENVMIVFPDIELKDWERREILAEVIGLAVQAMFENHFYEFGGKKFHQAQGGPIGLRGTCAIARVILQLFDIKWKDRLREIKIITWLIMRYVDDSRAILPPIKAGWRWVENSLKYSKRWEREDSEKSGEARTKEIIAETMAGIEDYLQFTAESGEEFPGGWLPTLDTSLKVDKNNQVRYRFYEKETAVKSTVQKESAMEENVKMQILAQDLVRRLNNSSEELGKKEKARVVDTYAQKLLNSGYDVLQVRKILINGIKGFENRKLRYTKNGWKLKRTAKESKEGRIRKSLLSKSSWYKKKKAKELYNKKGGSRVRMPSLCYVR